MENKREKTGLKLQKLEMSKKENVTGPLGWQGEARTHRKNWRFFQYSITGDYHDSCNLIWKMTLTFVRKNLGTTRNLIPEVMTKNLGTVQNSTPKHVACPRYITYWKIPEVILRSTGKY